MNTGKIDILQSSTGNIQRSKTIVSDSEHSLQLNCESEQIEAKVSSACDIGIGGLR